MPAITLLAWNLENFGTSKNGTGGAELKDLIAAVINQVDADVVGMCELRSNLAATIGSDLVTRLNNLQNVTTWRRQASAQYVSGRNEQYLFLWNSARVTTVNPNFQDTYLNALGATMGFPRQSTSDRPPYTGYFRTVSNPRRTILVAAFHAPRPSPATFVVQACNNLAQVSELQGQGAMSVIMGDFNVPTNAAASAANSNGATAFAGLIANYDQILEASTGGGNYACPSTSLVAGNTAVTNIADCYSEPYDQIFRRTNPNANNITHSNEGKEELIVDCMNGAYLEASLCALEGAINGMAPVGYTTVQDAFSTFRAYVSDHMPVVTDINF